jgi:hypothetical protein
MLISRDIISFSGSRSIERRYEDFTTYTFLAGIGIEGKLMNGGILRRGEKSRKNIRKRSLNCLDKQANGV